MRKNISTIIVLLLLVLLLVYFYQRKGIEGLDTTPPSTTTPPSPSYKPNNVDVDYHDTIDNLLEQDNIHTVNYIERTYPKSGNVTIKRVAPQGTFVYYNPDLYKYDTMNYVPNYEMAIYLSKSSSNKINNANFTAFDDLDDFSKKTSEFEK